MKARENIKNAIRNAIIHVQPIPTDIPSTVVLWESDFSDFNQRIRKKRNEWYNKYPTPSNPNKLCNISKL